jgi:hypothetical protein
VFEILIHGRQVPQTGESQRELRPQQVVPVCSSEHDDPLEPPPLKIRPAPAPIRRRTGCPHFGQVFKGLSDMLWRFSK